MTANDRTRTLKADPATFEIVKNSLYKIAEEMRVVLAKTAYSPILKSAGDYSCGVFDAAGEMVAQGPDLPIHLGSHAGRRPRRGRAPSARDVHDGDVFIHNDPYFGGSHLPDVNVVRPAFHEGRLLGYACLRAHWPDVGSATPGSYGAVTEIYGEGLRLPPLRLVSRGALNADLEKVILANVRTPDERKGDLGAQLAATLRATERLQALARRYGADELIGYMAEVMDYSERLMRATLADLPDGEGTFEDFCDGDGIPDDARRQGCAVLDPHARQEDGRPAGRSTSPAATRRSKGPINAPLSVTASGVYCGLKMAVDPNSLIPPNSGCWRTIEVKAPKGSVVNAEFPAPVVYANHEISHRVADMVMGALASFWPSQVMACSQGTSAILTLGGVDPRIGPALRLLRNHQGRLRRAAQQGRHQRHRQRHLQHHEHAGRGAGDGFPGAHRALRDQSRIRAAPGRYRGGCGARRVWRMLDGADATGALCMERMTSPPFGLLGGKRGRAAVVTLATPDGATRSSAEQRRIQRAGRLGHRHGRRRAPAASVRPQERDPAAIGRDLLDGYVSDAAAQAGLRHRRSGGAAQRPLQRRTKHDLHSQLDRGARHRQPGAHADQPAQAPDRRAAGHHARRRLPRVRQYRARLHRGGGGAVVRVARLRLRAARQGRLRADARARLLSPLSAPLERARGRAR